MHNSQFRYSEDFQGVFLKRKYTRGEIFYLANLSPAFGVRKAKELKAI